MNKNNSFEHWFLTRDPFPQYNSLEHMFGIKKWSLISANSSLQDLVASSHTVRYQQLSPYGKVERINVRSITKSTQLVVTTCMINSSEVGRTIFFFLPSSRVKVYVYTGVVVINSKNSVLGCEIIIALFFSSFFLSTACFSHSSSLLSVLLF